MTLLAALAAISVAACPTAAAQAEPQDTDAEWSVCELTCEQLENPVGIDTGSPCFGWQLRSAARGALQTAYQIIVTSSEDETVVWDSGKVASDNSIMVPYAGEPLRPAAKYMWKVRSWNADDRCTPWSSPATFITGLMDEADWAGAKWIALERDGELVVPAVHAFVNNSDEIETYRLPQFRKVFTPSGKVSRALLYVTGLGQFDCFLNGGKVGDHFLDPGWTKYDREALYVAFDVTDSIREGRNVLGVRLGNGFYHIPPERYFKMKGSFGAPKLRLNLLIRYQDGTTENVVSDGTWRATDSPLTYSSIYGGEDYDARKEQPGWASDTSFDEGLWERAVEVGQDINLKSQTHTPVKVLRTMPALLRRRNERGGWTYDMGQNFSGIIRVSLRGEAGQEVFFRPAELLNPDGTANQKASGEPYYFRYTLGGRQTETWQPEFTYYGFRYVQVEGAVPEGEPNPDALPVIISLEGLHTSNSAAEAGTFRCSKPLFNRIYELIDWAVRSNLSSITTDCPHREKLGWQEQNHLMQCSMQYRYSLLPLYRKIIDDMAASQREDGAVPSIAPEYTRFKGGFEDSPEWGSSFVISPWYLYQWYGDKRPIIKHYEAMKRYVDYLGTRADSCIVAYGLGDWFDIGPDQPGYAQLTSKGLTCTAMYYYDALILSKMAALTGRDEDCARYADLADRIRKAYNDAFFHPDTFSYDRDSQTANALSLFLGMPEPEDRAGVLESLVSDIRGRGNALTAGDIGYRYVIQALEENGRSDVIFDMNSRDNVPGYGWQLAHGATSLTESWQAYDNVSNNHLMLGHLMEWLFGGLGGIRQQDGSVAFHDILIDPHTVGDVTSAATTYESPYGLIRCEWCRAEVSYTLRVEIPANSRAIVVLPSSDPSRITESGVPISSRPEIILSGASEGVSEWSAGSGSYLFEISRQSDSVDGLKKE